MSLDMFKKMLEDVTSQAETMFARITDKRAFKRIVYASYLIARADGNFDADEKKALGAIISKDFPQFKLVDILDVLTEANSRLDFDVTMGTGELMQEISKASGDEAASIVRTACYIGASDGDFDANEKAVAKQICIKTGLNPTEYGL